MSTYHDGAHCFFKHPKDSWVLAQIVGKGPKGYAIKTTDTERQSSGETFDGVKEEDITTCREDLLDEQPNDLLSLTVLHDATLLRCLYLRYFRDIIYTNIGAIVVAINPFNFKIPWYMDDKMPLYLDEGTIIEKNLPHSWAQAHNTYNEMIQDNENQCILISGESGAGKTEATKIVMKYLAQLSCKRGTEEEKREGLLVGAKLNACSPVLECFGNARTVRNDNSSRFGKFMKVKFSKGGQVTGAETTKYLLEKSRIVTAAENERVYHSFYVVTRGWLAGPLKLEGEKAYRSINSGNCLNNSEFDTAEDFKEVTDAMTSIGMSNDEIQSIWSTVGGILSLQNVAFDASGEGSLVSPSTEKYLKDAVRLLKIDEAMLRKELVTTTLVIQKTETVKLLRPTLSADVRDALSKALYDGMFGWLVDKSNSLCDVKEHGSWIGLLDIFGFEDFQKNSFEQLCINLANETLQHHYNGFIFEKDMQECRAEGIDVTEVKCPDNTPCLKLIVDRGGILALLDEECTLGKGTEFEFLEKVTQAHSGHPFFQRVKTSRDTFIVHHYAADVRYDVNGWLDKNRDTLKDNVKTMMRNSTDTLVSVFLEAPLPPEARQKKLTVGAFFKGQVALLMDVINSTNPHWIRCIKPHPAKKPRMFDGVQTMNQLESSGVLGTVKIRKAGYPVRTIFDKFNVRYNVLVGDKGKGKANRDLAGLILQTCGLMDKTKAQLGKTKVFMKAEALPIIEKLRNAALLKYAMCVQKFGRGLLSRRQTCKENIVFKQKRMVALLQEEYRGYIRRSANIREERARWRREQEALYNRLRLTLEEEYRGEKDAMFREASGEISTMVTEVKSNLEEWKRQAAKVQQAQEELRAKEAAGREALFQAACAHVEKLRALYHSERILFSELLLASLGREEENERRKLEKAERDARMVFWSSYSLKQAGQRLKKSMGLVIHMHENMAIWEKLQRREIEERMVIERSYLSYRRTFKRYLRESAGTASEKQRARRHEERRRAENVAELQELLNGGPLEREPPHPSGGAVSGSWGSASQSPPRTGAIRPSPPAAARFGRVQKPLSGLDVLDSYLDCGFSNGRPVASPTYPCSWDSPVYDSGAAVLEELVSMQPLPERPTSSAAHLARLQGASYGSPTFRGSPPRAGRPLPRHGDTFASRNTGGSPLYGSQPSGAGGFVPGWPGEVLPPRRQVPIVTAPPNPAGGATFSLKNVPPQYPPLPTAPSAGSGARSGGAPVVPGRDFIDPVGSPKLHAPTAFTHTGVINPTAVRATYSTLASFVDTSSPWPRPTVSPPRRSVSPQFRHEAHSGWRASPPAGPQFHSPPPLSSSNGPRGVVVEAVHPPLSYRRSKKW